MSDDLSMTPLDAGDTVPLVRLEFDVEEDSSGARESEPTRAEITANLPRATSRTIALNTWLYMATPMSMPATVKDSGARLAAVFFTYGAVSTYWTGRVIGDAFAVDPDSSTYARMTSRATARVLNRHGYSDSTCERWRKKVELWTLLVQFSTYYLDACVQIVYVTQYFGQMFPKVKLCAWTWALLVGCLVMPVVQMPTLHDSGRVVGLPVVCVCVALVVLFSEIALTKPWEECSPGPTYGKAKTRSTMFSSLGNFAYAFGGHGLFPEELREMKDPSEWPQVMNTVYGTMVPIYIAVMYWGYKAYGDFAKGNINLNFRRNFGNVLSMLMQTVQCYYGVFFTNIALMMHVETALGVDPTTSWGVRTRFGVPPAIFRLIFRTSFLATQVLLAAIFLAASGDVIINLQGLAGAVGMTAMTFFLPSLIHYAFNMHDRSTKLEYVWVACNFLFGVLIMLSGLYGTISDILADSLVKQCPATYVYSPHDPRDPCHVGIHKNITFL